MQDNYQWCNICENGYPVVRKVEGRRFGAAAPVSPMMELAIKPMRLVSIPESQPEAPGSRPLPLTAKLKPAPSVPAAPDSLPVEFAFCVHQSDDGSRFLRYRDPSHKNHGMDVTEMSECVTDPSGSMVCRGRVGREEWIVPVCHQPEADKEPLPKSCCYDMGSSTLVCPGSAYDGLVVSFIEGSDHVLEGVAHVSIHHPDLPGGGARVPVCEPVDPIPTIPGGTAPDPNRPPGGRIEPECCVDLATSTLQECKDINMNGTPVNIKSEVDQNGMVLVGIPSLGWKGVLPVCADQRPPRPTRPKEPECCVDLRTSTLENCSDPSMNGTPVEIKGEHGPAGVPVYIPSLEWKGYLPVCAEMVPTPTRPPSDVPDPREPPVKVPDLCCYDPVTSSLVCEGTGFHGLVVELITIAELADGTKVASVAHESLPGGGARLIICESTPPTETIPPDIPDIPPREIPDIPEPPPREPKPVPEPPVLKPVPNLPPPSPGLPPHCCYSRSTGTLECAGSNLNGLRVELVGDGAVKDGWPVVKVKHPRLPGGYAVVPVCVTDCWEGQRQVLDRAQAERQGDGSTYMERWAKMAAHLAHVSDMECPGRRYAATHGRIDYALGDGCIGGTGISDRHKEYAPLPGLRGWQKGFNQ